MKKHREHTTRTGNAQRDHKPRYPTRHHPPGGGAPRITPPGGAEHLYEDNRPPGSISRRLPWMRTVVSDVCWVTVIGCWVSAVWVLDCAMLVSGRLWKVVWWLL